MCKFQQKKKHSNLKTENEPSWYCSDCKADCGLCSWAVLNNHKAVQCDKCEMWVHNKCSFVSDNQYENIQNSNCSWICPKCDFFNFSDSFFSDQLNLEEQNRFAPLSNDSSCGTKTCESGTKKKKVYQWVSININSIRGKKLELLAFLDLHQHQTVAIQETKIDSTI